MYLTIVSTLSTDTSISAAQAWNRNDARAAKALSLRGQAENDAMRKAHREAAKALYEERNQHLASTTDSDSEFYIDLHGLHPEEAVDYLDNVLTSHASGSTTGSGGGHGAGRIVYAITGTGHHSKNGKDKVGKAVRNWLNELGYTFREFSVPGERGGYVGGVLGIAATGGGKRSSATESKDDSGGGPVAPIGGKIQVLKREEIPT
jgi:DNA-nicking Smr family endonuclease